MSLKKINITRRNILWSLIVAVALPYVLYIPPQHLGANAYIVDSNSMAPNMPKGSVAYTTPTDTTNIEKGDVIVFTPNNTRIREERVIHRVIDIRQGNYTQHFKTQGDANTQPDPGWTPAYNVKGLRIFHIPYLGRILELTRSPISILLFVTLPSILLIREEIRNILKKIDEGKKENSRMPLQRSSNRKNQTLLQNSSQPTKEPSNKHHY